MHTALFPFIALEGTRTTDLAAHLGVTKQAVGEWIDELDYSLDPGRAALFSHGFVREWDAERPASISPAAVARFRAALPEGRRSILQMVWAFLPDACTERLKDAGFRPDYVAVRDADDLGPPRDDAPRRAGLGHPRDEQHQRQCAGLW